MGLAEFVIPFELLELLPFDLPHDDPCAKTTTTSTTLSDLKNILNYTPRTFTSS